MSNIKNFLTAEQAKKVAYESEKALNRVFKQIKLEAEDGNNFTDIDMSRLSTQAKARICDELVNAGYTTYPLCEFYGPEAHGLRIYWENVGIRDYNFDEEYFLKNTFDAKMAGNRSKNCVENFYLKDIMYYIKQESDSGNNSCQYQMNLQTCNENKSLKDTIKNILTKKGFKVEFENNILIISW